VDFFGGNGQLIVVTGAAVIDDCYFGHGVLRLVVPFVASPTINARRQRLTSSVRRATTRRVGQLGDVGANVPDVPATYNALAASATLSFGPFPTLTRWLIECLVGQGRVVHADAGRRTAGAHRWLNGCDGSWKGQPLH